jgi:hypothetical protein
VGSTLVVDVDLLHPVVVSSVPVIFRGEHGQSQERYVQQSLVLLVVVGVGRVLITTRKSLVRNPIFIEIEAILTGLLLELHLSYSI